MTKQKTMFGITTEKRGPVRPQPEQIAGVPEVEQSLTRCPKCDSTQLRKECGSFYGRRPIRQPIKGISPAGRVYNMIVKRLVFCGVKGCGQARYDVSYELVEDGKRRRPPPRTEDAV